MIVTGVLLAAGSATRFGGDKLTEQLGDMPLVLHSAAALTPCDRLLAVVREHDSELQRLLQKAGVEVIVNPLSEQGIGTSIARGVGASRNSFGWCILPADMPHIMPSTTWALIAALRAGAALTAPFYKGARGHPVGFCRRYLQSLLNLDGDSGARHIVRENIELMARIEVADASVIRDIDTRAQLDAARVGHDRESER